MNSDVFSTHLGSQIRIAEVVNYLQNHHWITIHHPNVRLLVFEKGTDDFGKPIQIVLPSRDDFEDTPHLLSKAINLLSILQSTSIRETIEAIVSDLPVSGTQAKINAKQSPN
jgi:hypothetical protein